MSLALLCSGQGGQHRGMFALTGPAAQASGVFDAATRVLGQDPRRFVQTAAEAHLFANRAGQILCCTQALAGCALLDGVAGPRIIAGYSVGELASWGCAGAIAPAELLGLAARRAELMDAASPAGSGLAGVIGIGIDALKALLEHGIAIAIVNAADSFVIGGAGPALDRSLAAIARRARVVRLRVAVAAHTPVLASASAAFLDELRRAPIRPPACRLLGGADGAAVRRLGPGLEALAATISNPIDWAACMTACREAGAARFLELGPGTALARMTGGRSIEDFRTAEGLRAWAAGS